MDFVEVISLNYSLHNVYIFISLGKATGVVLVSFDGDIFAYLEVICIAMQPWHTYFCRKEGTFLLVITNCFFFSVKTFHLDLISNEITAGSLWRKMQGVGSG